MEQLDLFSGEKKPLFITFEGGEGSGKSTQTEKFYDWFIPNYGPAVMGREPGGEPVAEKIRAILLARENAIEDLAELLLYEAARVQFVAQKLRPTIKSGRSLICDRFYDSTKAYQGYARGLDLDVVDYLNHLASGEFTPDLTFILDISPEKGLRNAGVRGELNRMDAQKIEFHRKVREGYLEIARENPDRCIVIPYQEGIELVQREIRLKFCEATGRPYEGEEILGGQFIRNRKGSKDYQLGLFGD